MKVELATSANLATAAETRAGQGEGAAASARAEGGTLAADFAAAVARAETLQQAHDALLQRITPQGDKPAGGSGRRHWHTRPVLRR
ncbi:hypothetical protein [Arthrobacter subterraneus]|uniref:hypothetical protein n=1 Tax=Arthrobacter subterraneus TaxID=335973 RepID=UPI000B864991|nr:hypothetical protein [Arthrobacter subterraneus]